MTFGEAAAIHLRNLSHNPRIKSSTRDYWHRRLSALVKNWRDLNKTEVRKSTQIACKEWASTYVNKASPTNYNNTIALLRHVLAIAIEAGVIYGNPAASLKRTAIRAKEIALPSTDKFNALLAEMHNGHSRYSPHCADFTAGLAFTGCRVGEAREIACRDVDFEAGEIVVRGDAETRTKNWELRRVPLIPDARQLFERMRSDHANEPLNARYSASASVRRRLIGPVKRSAPNVSRIMICGICSQRAASNPVWTYRLSRAGLDTKTAVPWQ